MSDIRMHALTTGVINASSTSASTSTDETEVFIAQHSQQNFEIPEARFLLTLHRML